MTVDESIRKSCHLTTSYASFRVDTVDGYYELFRAYRRTYAQVSGKTNIPETPVNVPPLSLDIMELMYDEVEARKIYEEVESTRITFNNKKSEILTVLLEDEDKANKKVSDFFDAFEKEQSFFAEENGFAVDVAWSEEAGETADVENIN